jgi:presenilin-like A22 family membrane protease
MDEFRVFKDALIYTVCSQTVSHWLDTSNTVSVIFLIMIFSVVVFIVMKANKVLATPAFQRVLPETPHRFLVFLGSTIMNLTLQFQSNLVARLAIETLSPGTGNNAWYIVSFATLSIVLLWLLAESMK